ncbi:MAG: protoheme IX farnesyltransferase [Alphaproteobacteria bacterium]|nr:MAG: protoheme IX farnesyltransferase [Alphaproteobacteria bacterium]
MALAEQRETTDGISLAMPRDYLALMKPRVMSLVVFTAFVGLYLAPGGAGGAIHPVIGAIAILCIAVGAGASGALNMWYDADIDAVMSRTAGRPIPAGRVAPGEALAFGLVLAAFSVAMLGLLVNLLAAALLAFTIFFYVVVYTMWLKRATPQNIVIGGAAGAFPPMIGWAAATGSLGLEPVILFAIIFLWTPPHFWALALVKRADYARAGIPMMPNVAGPRSTQNQILAYAVALAGVGLLPWVAGFAGPIYGLLAVLLGAEFVRRSFAVWRMDAADPAMVPARRLFAFSIVHLFALFATLLAEAAFGGLAGSA